MATYAIGDIQGCYRSFRELLDLCRFDPAQDRLWLVGDLVNRGPDSLATLRFIRDLGEAAITVLGNHDLYLLMVAAGGAPRRGKDDTLGDILAAPDRDTLLDWLRHRPLLHVEDGHCLVHAGLLPQWTVNKARRLAGEVETALRSNGWPAFMAELWGSEPASWCDTLTGWPRLRAIVNAMTRLRFCTPKGRMELRCKGHPSKAPAGCLPWFAIPDRKSCDHTLVVGHWSALGLRVEANLLALDSGCLWGRHLSAVRLPGRQVYQVDCAVGDAAGKVI